MRKEAQQRLALITCFFGREPWYFRFFLRSCAFNPSVDFLIFGDLQTSQAIPPNVKLVGMQLEEFTRLASAKLALQLNIKTPYKICDLKPTFGVIFSDFIESYEFWGHCDMDLIFGDIRGFMTDALLDHYDVICVREEYVTGFFTLYRNTTRINYLFKESKDHRTVLEDPGHFCFDECNFAWIELMNGKSIFEITTNIESMTHIVKRLHAEGVIKAHFNLMVIEGICGQLQWDHGRLYYADKIEALLYHLVQFKKQPSLVIPDWPEVPNTYYIGERDFSHE